MNTKAFEDVVDTIAKFGNEGGQLNMQAGVWLTTPFNLTSHMSLFLAEDVVILGVEESLYKKSHTAATGQMIKLHSRQA